MCYKRRLLTYLMAAFTLMTTITFNCAEGADLYRSENVRENNRWEGYVSEPVGSKFNVVSFHRDRIPRYTKGDKLTVEFYLPEAGNVRLNARELNLTGRRYAMEAIRKKWDAGWQRLSPWSVDVFLVPENIRSKNLGIEVSSSSDVHYPPYVFTKEPKKSNRYTIHFYTPASINELDYKILDASNIEIDKGDIKKISSKRTFPVSFSMEGRDEGFYKLSISVDWKHDPGEYIAEYRFYHKPI